jgi:hypothetical protein
MHILRIVRVYDPDVNTLPDEFRRVLTDQDVQAIQTGPEFFATLARADSPKWLRNVLTQCAESGYELQLYSADNAPYRPYFRFHWQGEPAISLPRPTPLRADLPIFLRRVYEVIGSFRENAFDMAGGLHAADALCPVSEMGLWVEPGGAVTPASAIPYLETFAGSQLCYLPDGGGAWLESCQFRKVRNLEREVARYFQALLKGTRI